MRVRREPALSRCHPTRPPITLLPSIMYTHMRRKGQQSLPELYGVWDSNATAKLGSRGERVIQCFAHPFTSSPAHPFTSSPAHPFIPHSPLFPISGVAVILNLARIPQSPFPMQ